MLQHDGQSGEILQIESTPQRVENLDGYMCLGNLADRTPIEIGLALLEDGSWRLLDKLPAEAAVCGTITRGNNGRRYFVAYAPELGQYDRNDPVPIEISPFTLRDQWVQYLGYPITTWPDGKTATVEPLQQFQPRAPRKHGNRLA